MYLKFDTCLLQLIHCVTRNHNHNCHKMDKKTERRQIKPIVFSLDETHADKDYHLVDRNELRKMDNATMKKRIDELNMRVQVARKRYRGTYDERHKGWMRVLVEPMKTEHKLALSLDALVAVSKK